MIIGFGVFGAVSFAQVENPQSDSIGIQGTIPADPPQTGATISFPTSGQVFDNTPITVNGICPAELLVKVFKNQVFAGSTICDTRGTFTLEIDLFSGRNDITAIVYDALGQPGPVSNVSSITFNDATASVGAVKLLLTTNFASKGADPGTILYWPMALSGGVGPYAISVDWGDGSTAVETLEIEGNFSLDHQYEQPGTYKVIVKAADSRGDTAFLQLVAISNGLLEGRIDDTGSTVVTRNVYVLWPLYVMMVFVVSTFWLGRRYEVRRIRKRIEKNQQVF
jgi:hypothetical protein